MEETPSILTELEEQFLLYQSMAETDIPKHVWDAATVTTNKMLTRNFEWRSLETRLSITH